MSREEAAGLLKAGQYDDAVEALRPFATVENPETRDLFNYAQALVGANRQSLAVWPLERLVHREDATPAMGRLFVSSLLYGGAEEEAVREATRLLEENPDARAIRSLRSQAFESILDLESAIEDVEIIVDESPGEARWVERLLNLLIKVEDWDGAEEQIGVLRKLLQREGVQPGARAVFCATAARFEKEHGEVEEAEQQLRTCLEESPFDPNLLFSLAELLDQSDRVAEATALIEAVSKRAPKRQLIQRGLAARYTRLDRYDDADALLVRTAEQMKTPDGWLAVADLRVLRGDLDGAAEVVDRAVEIAMGVPADDPDLDWSLLTPESRFGLGDVYIRARKFEPADRIIESLEEEPGFGLLLRGRSKLEREDPEGALADYQEAFRSYPSHPAARYLAGRAALEVGDFELAVEMYQDSLRADPKATDAGLVLARILLAEGRTAWAIDTLGFFLISNPDDPHAIRLMAQAGAASGQHEWAQSVRAVLARNPNWAGIALAEQAKDHAFLNGFEAAEEYLSKSEALEEPANFEAFSAWVTYARAGGKDAAARKRAEALKERHPDAAGPWIVWSRVLYEDGERAEAISAIRKALELNPMIPTASAELAEMLLAAGEIDEAIIAFDRASELDPLDARAAISAAKGLLDAGRIDEAEARLREVLIQHPWHGRAAVMLVGLLRDRGKMDDWTYHLARRAVRYVGISGPEAFAMLARIELEREDAAAAAQLYDQAIKASHDVPNMQYGLATALVALDQPTEARSILELALASDELENPMAALALMEEIKEQEQTP